VIPDKPTPEQPDQPDQPVRDEPEVGAAIGIDEIMDNDEESHVPPSDNDGETVPGQEGLQ
jgi:hypothetical protein